MAPAGKKKSPAATTPQASMKKSPGTATAQATAEQATAAASTAPAVKSGEMVHYHAETDATLTEDTAHPALVLKVTDKEKGRADLLAHGPNGNSYRVLDVHFSAERAAGAWSQRDA